jgi:pyruvate dehydrogenase E1 component alpha subunit
MNAKKYGKKKCLHFYREMVRLRVFDTTASELFTQGLLAGNIHTCLGQEASHVGACQALEPDDYITSTHRGHGHCLAKGGRIDKMMAELFGKATGYCKGKGGSMHIADFSLGILGANGIVGAGMPIAVGSALASRIYGDKHVTMTLFGDGASNQGLFHEALNMASAWKLPVIFVCENNLYGVSTCISRISNVQDLSVRAKAYDIPGITVDGTDVFAVYEAARSAVDHARGGQGPVLIETKTWRYRGHYEGDPQVYKSKEEKAAWEKKDCIDKLHKAILDGGLASGEELDAIEREIRGEVELAVEFAKNSPYPEPREATEDVYVIDNERCVSE